MNEEELHDLQGKVARSGLKRETFIREILAGAKLKERPSMDLIDTLRSLQQINNNMNQIAAKANAVGVIDAEKYWRNVYELQNVTSELLKVMYS